MPVYPEDLDRSISRGDASLLGVSWRELSGPLWRSPYRGVHVWSATAPDDPRQRALDAAALLPDHGAVGGWAAAQLGGAVELDGRGLTGTDSQPVMLCLPRDARIRRGPGTRPLRSVLGPEDVTAVAGIQVTRPLRTAFDIARTSPLDAAVVAIDYLARGRPEFLAELHEYVRAHTHLRGGHLVGAALRRASCRSRSAGETRLRLFWTCDVGFAEPLVNPWLQDDDGFGLGMPDLLDLEAGLAAEYDGAGHRDPLVHANDNAREESLEDSGLVVVRFTSRDLGPGRRRAKARLLAGRERGRAVRTRPRRWSADEGPLPEPTPHW